MNVGRRWVFGWTTLCSLMALAPLPAAEPAADAEGIAFFEQKIRPILVKHCYECHSGESKGLKGGLLLDSRDGWVQGGDSGPALVPGQVDDSLLIAALRFDGLQMPPQGKLPPQVIADFELWIQRGAPDPRTGKKVVKGGVDVERGRQFWAYQLPRPQTLPEVRDAPWVRNQVDSFILAKLEAAGFAPARDAEPGVLLTRLHYDLIGLPPTAEELQSFTAQWSDPATRETAYAATVDRLLNSTHFGERWGRHWLDIARYGESLTLRGFVLKDAWRYRDYVIESFNADRPFDQFIREQIAGDLLPHASLDEHRRQLIATTFLALGNNNLEEQDKKQLAMDIVDEQLDVISKGILAQTITCARCHDHKFDPIPTKDYYALAGILRNTKTVEHSNVSMWLSLPLPAEVEVERQFATLSSELSDVQSRIKTMKSALASNASPATAVAASTTSTPAIVPLAELNGIIIDDEQATKIGAWQRSQHTKRYIGEGYSHDINTGKGEKTITFIPELPKDGRYEVRLAYIPASNRATKVLVTVFSAEGELELTINQREEPPIDGRWLSLGRFRFEKAGQSFVLISNEASNGHVTADAVQFIPVEQLAEPAPTVAVAPVAADAKPAAASKPSANADALKELEDRAKRLTAEMAKRPARLGIAEESTISDTSVHIRGSVHQLGERAPRGFLQVATYGPTPQFNDRESGRRELADWLASRDNPLTSRVMVNRAWLWLFGAGLVRTPDNFGTTGELPTHPELLDHLALKFVDDGWSIKELVRTLVMSRTYRQASQPASRAARIDPDNRLWSHTQRRRFDAEALRDKLLWASGALETTPGGPTFKGAPPSSDYLYQHTDVRRSVYSPSFRNSLVELLEVFDAADPSTVTGQRNSSTVAPQALYLMNHPFVLEQTKLAARRLLSEPREDDAARIEAAYLRLLQRTPTATEAKLAAQFLTPQADETAEARERRWSQWVQVLVCSLDFRFVD